MVKNRAICAQQRAATRCHVDPTRSAPIKQTDANVLCLTQTSTRHVYHNRLKTARARRTPIAKRLPNASTKRAFAIKTLYLWRTGCATLPTIGSWWELAMSAWE